MSGAAGTEQPGENLIAGPCGGGTTAGIWRRTV